MKRLDAQLRLDLRSETPAYRQIAAQLRTFVIEGILQPGDSLPPVRRLALDLGVHFNTVAEAYRLLAQEDFVEITHGHGARVIDWTRPVLSDPRIADSFRQKLRELIAGARADGLTTKRIAGELKVIAEGLEKTP